MTQKRSLSRKDFLLFATSATGSALLAMACSSDTDERTTGAGGSSGTGGSSSTGGSSATGGGSSTGGSSASGGSTGSGGSAATGGGDGTGGSTGTGGTSAGSGGSPTVDAGSACSGDKITAKCSPGDGKVGGHTHVLEVPIADVLAGATKTYQTIGGSHCHQVEVTANDFATLQSGGVVRKPTCNGGDHEFLLSCAADSPEPVNPTTCGGDTDVSGEC